MTIPVTVITGFLGSGKTTLLGRLLRHPALGRTAVIINEFGEIGLDHDLIESSDEDIVTLTTGCLCCTVRSDLVLTLGDLLARRDRGELPPFERVVVETTGLADPAPILHALMTDTRLAGRAAIDGVVATVDAVNGLSTLDRQIESVKQAAMADRLVITKTDLATGGIEALGQRLDALNPGAPRFETVMGEIDPAHLFGVGLYDPAAKIDDVGRWLAHEAHHAEHAHDHGHLDVNRHDAHIAAFAVTREQPVKAIALTLFLETLAEHCGPDLLRVKGIVNVAESPDRPAVIHGVQHIFHPPTWLDGWPSDDRRTRLVFIARDLPRRWIESLMDLLDAEVADEEARSR
jgi:G3E family GTPase